jgi:hypothetical protein
MNAAISSCRAWMNSILPSAEDAIARATEHAPHSPGMKACDDEITDCLRHKPPSRKIGPIRFSFGTAALRESSVAGCGLDSKRKAMQKQRGGRAPVSSGRF